MFCRNKRMTPLQRHSLRWMSIAMLLAVLMNFLFFSGSVNPLTKIMPFFSALTIEPGHAPIWKMLAAGAVMLFPVLLAVFVAARYLAQEPDEFIRSMVMRALLWGIACTMAVDAIISVTMAANGGAFPIELVNAEVLFVATMVSFRLVTWRYSR